MIRIEGQFPKKARMSRLKKQKKDEWALVVTHPFINFAYKNKTN